MKYINRKDSNGVETVDEFKTTKEAKDMLTEYQVSDTSAQYYISQRACGNWKD